MVFALGFATLLSTYTVPSKAPATELVDPETLAPELSVRGVRARTAPTAPGSARRVVRSGNPVPRRGRPRSRPPGGAGGVGGPVGGSAGASGTAWASMGAGALVG